MTRLFSFRLDQPGLQGVSFLVQRDAMPCNGDLECDFLNGITDLYRHALNIPLATTLMKLCASCDIAVVSRNPALVLDAGLQARIAQAISQLAGIGDWALAGAGGLGLHDRRHIALYASENPIIPENAGLQPLIDLMPDLYIVNAAFLREMPASHLCHLDQALEPALALLGYFDNRVSVILPCLAAGINGDLMTRDLAKVTVELNRTFADRLAGQVAETLSGPIRIEATTAAQAVNFGPADLDHAITDTIAERSDLPALTIVTRTRFDRLHLLRRMLTSISRARRDAMTLEIVLSTDADPAHAEEAFKDLEAEFVNLRLRLKLNPARGHSRVTNLMGGIQIASGEYVMFLDDDDYLDMFAFDAMRPATFAGNRPVIALTSAVHEETWQETPTGRWVLSHSMQMSEYPASGWRQMFTGVNKLPICGLVLSRARLRARLKAFPLQHDLSEDYALFLLMLTDPELPAIHECPQPAVHISIRDSENSVLMTDRRPWVRDITRYLCDLTGAAGVSGAGQWALLRDSKVETVQPPPDTNAELQSLLDRRAKEIWLLRAEVDQLRRLARSERENAA